MQKKEADTANWERKIVRFGGRWLLRGSYFGALALLLVLPRRIIIINLFLRTFVLLEKIYFEH